MNRAGTVGKALSWVGIAIVLLAPLIIAVSSPLHAWREPVYIAASIAGVLGLCLLFVQPMLAGEALPGVTARRSRNLHGLIGGVLLAAIVVHVIGLWLTSPPDVVDAMLFRSPTPFSLWGVIAMWAIIGAAVLALCRRRLRAGPWRLGHSVLAAVTVASTIAHALLIDGTMGTISKAALCLFVALATARALLARKVWRRLR